MAAAAAAAGSGGVFLVDDFVSTDSSFVRERVSTESFWVSVVCERFLLSVRGFCCL